MSWASIPWNEGVSVALSDALGSDSQAIRADVEAGLATLWRVKGHGYFITRLEQFGSKSELVLVAWQGRNTGPLINYLKDVCVRQGINSMRFHTSRPEKVVTRFVKKWGFEPVETVYKLGL